MHRSFRPLLVAAALVASVLLSAPIAAAPGPPTADPQTVRTPKDVALPLTLHGHDAGAGDAMTFVATDPANGTLSSLGGSMSCNPSGQNCAAAVTYTPDPGYQGPDRFTFTVTDSEVPPEESTPALVSIAVNALPVAVNDPSLDCQVLAFGGSFPIPEDWPEPFPLFGTCAITTNDTDADGDVLTYEIMTVPANGDLTEVDETIVAYQPDPNFSTIAGDQPGGSWNSDSFTYTAFDGFENSATAATMRFWVAPINDPPSFTPGPDVTGNEDAGAYSAAWATAISDGPANESGQTVHFEVTDLDVTGVPNLFAVDPAISSAGVLTYTTNANEYGLATVTVRAVDNGGLEDYDITDPDLPVPDDTSDEVTFSIAISGVNDAPTYTKGANQSVATNAGAETVTGWATSISAGPADESGQVLTFSVVGNTTPSLFSVAPSVSASTGTLTYTIAPGVTGTSTITLRLGDNGGTANGGVNLSQQTFTISVSDDPNNPPSFTKGANQTVLEDSGARSVTGWATSISPGAGETGQTLTFSVTGNTNSALFSVQPAVASNGTLTFTPAANRNGTSTISLVLIDNGGGGTDTSATATFTITITAVNDAPNAANDVGVTINQNATAVAIPVMVNDSALPDTGETLHVTAVSAAGHGTVTITGGGTGLAYTPAPTYRGSDLFTYTLSDGALTDTATVLLEVVQAGTVTRLSGADRYATSAAISKASYAANVPVVYIATGTGFADALSGAPVAGALGGPILLVPGTSLPTVIRTELTRLKPAKIVILGGTGAVSGGVATALDAYTTGTVTRLSGADRYATSAAISKASYAANVPVVYIATGTGFADALSGAPVAGALGGPILLVPGTSLPTVIRTELTRLKPAKIVILGGTGAVSGGVATALDAYTTGTVTRLSGADRYATSAAISKASYAANVPVVYIATGTGFADALSGAPVAGALGGPILLVPGTSLPTVIRTELTRLKPAKIVILGGTGAVSGGVATALGLYTTAS